MKNIIIGLQKLLLLSLVLLAIQGCVSKKVAEVNGIPELITASEKGSLAEVSRMIADGADLEARDNKGRTALMQAARYRQPEIVSSLLMAGADVNAHAANGWTALMAASYRGEAGMVSEMLLAGADVNTSRNDSGMTVLMWGVRAGNPDVVKILLNAGADKDVKSKKGTTALEQAKEKGDEAVIAAFDSVEVVAPVDTMTKPSTTTE